jgi:hypothetical protein
MTRLLTLHTLVIVALGAMMTSSVVQADPLMYRPGQEYRSLNTGAYEIGIQKSGRVDVGLTTGQGIFLNAFPMVWIDGEDKPEAARLDGRMSNRFEVNDALGRGQGMHIGLKEHTWSLSSYPTKPFMTAQYTYTNTSKKPVTIKQLIPWAIGDPRKGAISLGDNTLHSIMLTNALSDQPAKRLTQHSISPNMISVLNPQTGSTLLAGFITQNKAITSIELSAKKVDADEPHHLDYMRAICSYDPPVTLQPGESLDSEVIYLAIGETDPLLAMERYAKGVAVTNRVPVYSDAPTRTVLLTQEPDQDFAQFIETEVQSIKAANPKETSIQIVLDLDVDGSYTRYPNDEQLKNSITWIHAQGYQVGLTDNPFTFPKDFPEVLQNPDWFMEAPIRSDQSTDRSDILIDLTKPQARVWFEAYIQNRIRTLGFDSLWDVNYTDYLLVRTGTGLTHVETMRIAMNSLRAALDPSVPLITAMSDRYPTAPSVIPLFPNTHIYQLHDRPAQFFQVPHLGHQYRFLMAPTGQQHEYASTLLMGQHLMETSSQLIDTTYSTFFPSLLRPAKPNDLFYTDTPSVWIKRGGGALGNWILAGVNNVGEDSRTVTLPLDNPNLRIQPQYTLFDVEQGKYFGKTQININVAPNTTRILLMREVKNQPIVLGSSYPIADVLPDVASEGWNRYTHKLGGRISTRDSEGTLYVLVPKSWKPDKAMVNGVVVEWAFKDDLLHLSIPAGLASPLKWSLTFSQ